MEEHGVRNPLIERRTIQESSDGLWSNLTLAQKLSASSLEKYGYELTFVRCSSTGNSAIMMLDNHTTIVSFDGSINTSPQIKIR
jgi:hypothetical protein